MLEEGRPTNQGRDELKYEVPEQAVLPGALAGKFERDDNPEQSFLPGGTMLEEGRQPKPGGEGLTFQIKVSTRPKERCVQEVAPIIPTENRSVGIVPGSASVKDNTVVNFELEQGGKVTEKGTGDLRWSSVGKEVVQGEMVEVERELSRTF